MSENKVHITLADSQYLTSLGLRYVLSANQNLHIVSVAGHKTELIEQLQEHQPHLLILDYNDADFFQIDDLQLVPQYSPQTKVLIISADKNKLNITNALNMGIAGFLTKKCQQSEVLEAIETIMQGKQFFCNRVLDVIEAKKANANTLTKRETEIIEWIAKGLSTKSIAEKLFLSTHTISTHRKNILRKLDLNSPSDLIVYALKEGLVTPE